MTRPPAARLACLAPARLGRLAAACLLAVAPVLAAAGPAGAAAQPAPLPEHPTGCLPPPQVSDPDTPWAQQQLAPQRVWPITRGAGVTVGVVDTGVDARSPQLAGRVLPGVDLTGQGGRADTDCYGHGTFVTGIIAAAPDPTTGFAGVAPDVRILPARSATQADDGTAHSLATGIRATVDGGAQVINISASTNAPNAELAAAADYAAAHDVLVVASAANGAKQGDPVTYPASYPTVLAVGAIDSTGAHADFSQIGPYVGLVAPGVDVISIGPGGRGQWQGSGTSYAAPFVAGVAALVRAYHPELTAEQVKHRLEATADHPATDLPDPQLGWGTVNPMAAVTAVLPDEGPRAPMMRPPAITPPHLLGGDTTGPVLALIGVYLVGMLALLARMAFRLWPGRRGDATRRRRRRVVVVPDGSLSGTRRD